MKRTSARSAERDGGKKRIIARTFSVKSLRTYYRELVLRSLFVFLFVKGISEQSAKMSNIGVPCILGKTKIRLHIAVREVGSFKITSVREITAHKVSTYFTHGVDVRCRKSDCETCNRIGRLRRVKEELAWGSIRCQVTRGPNWPSPLVSSNLIKFLENFFKVLFEEFCKASFPRFQFLGLKTSKVL